MGLTEHRVLSKVRKASECSDTIRSAVREGFGADACSAGFQKGIVVVVPEKSKADTRSVSKSSGENTGSGSGSFRCRYLARF